MKLKTVDDLVESIQIKLGLKKIKEMVKNEIELKFEEYMYDENIYEMKDFDEFVKKEGYTKEELDLVLEYNYFDKNDKYFKNGTWGYESFSTDLELFFETLEEIEKKKIFKKVLEKCSKK